MRRGEPRENLRDEDHRSAGVIRPKASKRHAPATPRSDVHSIVAGWRRGIVPLALLIYHVRASCIYRLTRLAIGLNSDLVFDDASNSLAILLVAAPVLACHAIVLFGDLGLAGRAQQDMEREAEAETSARPAEVPAETAAGEPVAASPSAAGELVIVGLAGADLESLRQVLGGWPPPGFTVEVRE
jgi:hypothetical protein